jgi:hypothetical protein
LVSEETLTEAFSPAKLNDGTSSFYGFGWDLEQDSTLGKVVRHSGDNPGYKTHFIRFLDRDYTVIVLCNNAHDKFDEIVNRLTTQIRMK